MNWTSIREWVAPLGTAGVGAFLLYVCQLFLQWRKNESTTGLAIKQHRDGLTLDLLREARAELGVARTEIHALRGELEERDDKLARVQSIEWRLNYYDEAIEHIEALLLAEAGGGREAAEHAARVFLAKHEAMKLHAGRRANAAQVARASHKLTDRSDRE